MLGAIAGDIAGSVYEFDPIDREDFEPFFAHDAFFTDDTVLTVAVADVLLHDRDPVEAFKDWGHRYPDMDWGGMFGRWLFSDATEPYGSYGNGAAMRISPAGFLARTLDGALADATRLTAVTHDHPQGIAGGRAVAEAVFRLRAGEDAAAVRRILARRYGYDLDRTVAGIRPTYTFDETCQRTVPEALVCAFEATSCEDAIRKAISLGGDADTLAAIAGAVAEARFGLPDDLAADTLARLPDDMRALVREMYARAGVELPPAADGR